MPHDILQNHSASFTSKSWIWGFLKHRNPKPLFFPIDQKQWLGWFWGTRVCLHFRFLQQYHHFRSVCPATIGVPKPMQGCILIATLKIGAAQVGTRNSIPGGNSGCCTFPYISLKLTWYVVSFMILPIPQQKQRSCLWPVFFGLFLRVYLSGDYYNTVSAFPVNLCHVWLIGKAVGLHWNCLDSQVPPFLMQSSCIPACFKQTRDQIYSQKP